MCVRIQVFAYRCVLHVYWIRMNCVQVLCTRVVAMNMFIIYTQYD